jgi:cell division protein FtsQ
VKAGALSAPSDKRFRRARVKPSRKRKLGVRHLWLAVRLASVIAVAGYAAWRGTSLVLGAPALRVADVRVRGNERLSTGEILALVDGLKGRNILTVKLDVWRSRILASPWVEEATLRRVLPSVVEVAVRERRPIGIARLGRALYLVDRGGVIVDEYGPNYADLDLPILDGLASAPADGASLVDDARAALAARLIAALEARPDLASRISQIDVSDLHDVVVILKDDTAMLRLGDEEFVDRLQEYLDLAPSLRERVSEIDYVDLRFGDRLYVRPVGGTKPAPAGLPMGSAR